MDAPGVDALARALLYEGYALYPYRADALKNRHRWTPGVLVPRAHSTAQDGSEPWSLQAQCLVRGRAAVLTVQARFLHLLVRKEPGRGECRQEATEERVTIPEVRLAELIETPRRVTVSIAPSCELDAEGGRLQHGLDGDIECRAEQIDRDTFRVTVLVRNTTPLPDDLPRDEVLLRSMVSAHLVLSVTAGEFVSLLDPPDELWPEAERCRNIGIWPVLVGSPPRRDTLLASPIVLYDYPRIAPESAGDFFDGTEIDEMLALRVLTLTDDEKRRMSAGDARVRALLERVEEMTEARFAGLHGAIRECGVGFRVGDRVRLRPRGGADALDIVLAGKLASVVAVEQDFEGRWHVAVTVDDDPGRDLGDAGMPGHRFFFRPDEVDLLTLPGEQP